MPCYLCISAKQHISSILHYTLPNRVFSYLLGIKLIVMPIVAVVIAATIYASFGIDAAEPDNGASVVMGIALILVSMILRYGAELEQRNKGQENISE